MKDPKQDQRSSLEQMVRALNQDLEVFIEYHMSSMGDEERDDDGLLLTARLPPTVDECPCPGLLRPEHRCWLKPESTLAMGDGSAGEEGEAIAAVREKVRTIIHGLLEANRQLASRASRDPLTGVLNRSFFSEALQLEMAKAQREGGRIMFIMVDIDRFKMFNDEHGHLAGDQVLTKVAERLTSKVRASDMVIRFGGDEFLVVAPRKGEEDSCEPILGRLQNEEPLDEKGELSLSMGCSSWSPDQDIDEVLDLADRRMYEHKRGKG